MRKLLLQSIFVYFFVNDLQAQNLQFELEVNDQEVQKNTPIYFKGDTIRITSFKFYITNFECYDDAAHLIWEQKKPILLDVFSTNSCLVPAHILAKTQFVNFDLGCDTTLSGMPPLTGELSASKGMFWTWKEGYMSIHFEGTHNLSPQPKHQFVLHLAPSGEAQFTKVVAPTNGNSVIRISLDEFLIQHSFAAFPTVMEINEMSTNLLYLITQSFGTN